MVSAPIVACSKGHIKRVKNALRRIKKKWYVQAAVSRQKAIKDQRYIPPAISPKQAKQRAIWGGALGALAEAKVHADLKDLRSTLAKLDQNSTNASFVYVDLLRQCIQEKALPEGERIHGNMVKNGFVIDRFIANLLMQLYAKCGRLDQAVTVFNGIREKNRVSYSIMISAYAQYGHHRTALDLYSIMEVEPDGFVLATALSSCARLKSLAEGRAIHEHIEKTGFPADVVLRNAIVNMYAKCGDLGSAKEVFGKMKEKNAASWCVMICGYVSNACAAEGLKLYRKMTHEPETIEPSCSLLASVLGACASLKDLAEGKAIHESIVGTEAESDKAVGTALINMYAKCGSLRDACLVFKRMQERDIVAWNAMISGYTQNGQQEYALRLYKKLLSEGCVQPDKFTFATMLGTCCDLGALKEGKRIHARLDAAGFKSDLVFENALLNMYAKCGSPEDAKRVFDKMHEKDVVSWTAMVAAYAQNGYCKEALELFRQMDVRPNGATFATALNACSTSGDLAAGKMIDDEISKSEFKSDVQVQNALVNMYGKCGKLDYARWEFDRISRRNTVSWNTLIAAYAQHGHGRKALDLYPGMHLEGVEPDAVTFIGVLVACSHTGLMSDGWENFISMISDYGISPVVEHFGCMIDLLGRAGKLAEADELIRTMPFEPGPEQWTALLASCKVHGDAKRGAHSAYHILDLDPTEKPPYVLLSNIYAAGQAQVAD